MKSFTAPVALLVYLAMLSTRCAAHEGHSAPAPALAEPDLAPGPAPGGLEPEIIDGTFVEGLQAGDPVDAPEFFSPEECSEFCLGTEDCIAWSHNSNDLQCRVFRCINLLQPNNPDYVSGIFANFSCTVG